MNKKAQEEMIGFVMIILLVAIIFLVFLGITIRQNSSGEATDSLEVSQFLDSMIEYTTECSYDNGDKYESIEDLLVQCNQNNRRCDNNQNVCNILESTIKQIIEKSWTFTPESKTRGYEFKAIFRPIGIDTQTKLSEDFPATLFSENSPCSTANRRGSEKPIFAGQGTITISLEICG